MELHITGLSKTYANGVQALDDVTLTIPTGMFGLLGPNGAGKSTLMRTLATLQDADHGSAQLAGAMGGTINVLRDKDSVRRVLGYLPQDFGVYPKVSAEDMLDHLARLKGLTNKAERADVVAGLLRQTNLFDVRKSALGGFSGGMRQRFGIAQALLGNPKLIIVDEPTAGLDPEERTRFHNLLVEIGEEVIVLLSTHIVSDVSDLCPNLAIMNKGRVLVTGTPQQLIASLAGRVWATSVGRGDVAAVRERHAVISTRLYTGQTQIHVISDDPPGAGFVAVEATLEDAYFAAIGGHLARDHREVAAGHILSAEVQ
jgi:ABC-type multidrug transport system ATPase subunit